MQNSVYTTNVLIEEKHVKTSSVKCQYVAGKMPVIILRFNLNSLCPSDTI